MELTTTKRSRSSFDNEAVNLPKRAKTNHPEPQKKCLVHKDYTVGWVCALATERAAAESMLDDIHEPLSRSSNDTNTYTLGNIGSHNVVIACLPFAHYGTTNAALVANNMMWTFPSIETKLMVGIGGGAPAKMDIRLGDVVVGTKVMQCDFGKLTNQGLLRTSTSVRPPQAIMTAVSKLQARLEQATNAIPDILSRTIQKFPEMKDYAHPKLHDRLFSNSYEHPTASLESCDDCDRSELLPRPHRHSTTPKLHYGVIASSNQVMKYAHLRDAWTNSDDVICFEMEAAGLVDHFQCLVIRGICDYSDSHKNKRWQKYAALTAAAYTRQLLCIMDVPHVENTPSPTVDVVSNTQDPPRPNLSPEQREALLDSLRFDQIDARRYTIKKAHSKTCKWLLKNDQYLEWLDPAKFQQHRGFLWIKGKPGTGKSTLMKFALQNAQRSKNKDKIINFFFNARGDDLEKSTIGMYRSLLVQIFEMFPDQQHVLDSRGAYITAGNQWNIELLKEIFEQVIQSLQGSPVTCYIDALDECDEDQIRNMISFFESIGEDSISTRVNLSICFSSRHYPHITMNHGLELILDGQEGHNQDITDYIGSELKIGCSKLAEALRVEIQEKSSGIFMWVILVVDILKKEFDRGRIRELRKRLQEIPADLHELFQDILTRDSHNKDELLLCIQWVLFARSPMAPGQLYYAILAGTDPSEDTPGYEESFKEDVERFLLSSSKGLTEITKSQVSTVQFIHESVRDFLLKDNGIRKIWPELGHNFEGKSHEQLKSCCRRYSDKMLSLVDLKVSTKAHRWETNAEHPFLEYAIFEQLFHADRAAGHGISQREFVSTFDAEKWIKLRNYMQQHQTRQYQPGTRLLYILAQGNYAELIKSSSLAPSCVEVGVEQFGC